MVRFGEIEMVLGERGTKARMFAVPSVVCIIPGRARR